MYIFTCIFLKDPERYSGKKVSRNYALCNLALEKGTLKFELARSSCWKKRLQI
jgi:hypothetical protein